MAPKTAPISSAARRSKRVVDSESASSTGEPSASPPPAPAPRRARAPPAKAPARATRGAGAEKRVTYAEHSEDDDDGVVEEESEEDELEEEDESMEVDEPAPVNPLRIKLTVKRQAPAASGPSGTRIKLPSRSLSPQKKAASKKRKSREETLDMEEQGDGEGEQDDLEEDQLLDEEGFEDDERRHPSSSPSKMTARQRAKGNSDLQDHLLVLEEGRFTLACTLCTDDTPARPTRALQLTEQEKIERKEEASRRRRRQIEQRLQDEQDETINRLLRAQTSRSRAKIDDDNDPSTGNPSPSRRIQAPPEGMVRWTSKMGKEGAVVMSVAVPTGQERWLDMGAPSVEPKKDERMCNAPGCGEKRKYRSLKVFEKGGCSMAHLETVEAAL
ncbi:hypothetical protein L198_01525 [Cryptococcus wingfieldii CBS 7118]|uniref:INO80 complex subunit B-like conserved region domain-containing protein n=1 Tax=Cryptococcus wingfieldii CBS 7118 TaxID=1295528 RepID=A0A1E3JZU7_9TREE|nr:hypothetical protein L198_01525 [Cryptococcus wingfieldii CBS 7118]ODO06293.1 hypothetical protein L198_01525 [Cryptococcus wingfieldii CBS 7118]